MSLEYVATTSLFALLILQLFGLIPASGSGFAVALVANGLPAVPSKPYTNALVGVLMLAPLVVLWSFETFMFLSSLPRAWEKTVFYGHLALFLVLLACFVVLAGPPGHYVSRPDPLLAAR